MLETRVQPLGLEDPLEKETATNSSILAWKIPWTEEPCRLQSMGSQRVGHNWATSLHFTSSHSSGCGYWEATQTGKHLKSRGAISSWEDILLPPRHNPTQGCWTLWKSLGGLSQDWPWVEPRILKIHLERCCKPDPMPSDLRPLSL